MIPLKVYLSPSLQKHNIGADGVAESDRMRELALAVQFELEQLGVETRISKPSMTLAQSVEDSNAWKPDLHLALHSNAGGSRGLEAWVHTGNWVIEGLAKHILTDLSNLMGMVVRRGRQSNFAHFTNEWTHPGQMADVDKTDADALLLELFFHDNWDDLTAYERTKKLIPGVIAHNIHDFLKGGMGHA